MLERVPFDRGQWLNPPRSSRIEADRLWLETAEGTDFWSQTHYGFEHASGHGFLFEMPARFAAEVTFSGRFVSKYEQAGLLLWESEKRWIKAGIEYADGRPNLAVVVTNGRSDWSLLPADTAVNDWTIRMTATDSAVIVHARGLGGWQILRVADFVVDGARVGPMACSPLGKGLKVEFSDFRVGTVPGDPLYITPEPAGVDAP